ALTVMGFPKYSDARNYDAQKLKQLAKKADYIILALGEPAYAESPGALDDLRLPLNQIQLAQAAHATGKPVVLVLAEGRPRVIADIVEKTGAIMQAYRPGSQGARAIAGVLTGEFNPSGVLPYSYPQYTGDITPYDRRVLSDVQQLTPGNVTKKGYKPQWPFGFGLSYSTFAYSNLSLSQSTMKKNESVRVSVTVKNTSGRAGKHAVELYISDVYASLSPAAKRLKKFTKIFLSAGEQKLVHFDLHSKDLEFVDASLRRVVEPGDFKLQIGDLEKEMKFL
ncbi:glycoside hydrolase family 3 C-terminal domain-containing protein, partial [Pseudomonadales bacterium]|nr:glycoside hydrolase family 3 C-terminal domain-containing protein [Pseudomonadales bacterium]